jgi:hypothetical protein
MNKNQKFAVIVCAIQLVQAMMILSCRYPDMHWLCIWNIIASLMIMYKYLSDDE